MQRGDLTGASSASDFELKKFSSDDSEWHWRFTQLKAEVLVRQRFNRESLRLLQPEIPSRFASCDLAVWRELTQSSANTYLFQFDEAGHLLNGAETLAKQNCPKLLGEVALRKGTLAHLRGDAPAAEAEYREARRVAHEQKDAFLEVAALGSLGGIATKKAHYDESIDWDRAALALAQSIGIPGSESKIQGNMAWSYFEMGDFVNSLELYRRAEAAAATAGLQGDGVYWRKGIGNVNLAIRDLESADREFHTALTLAQNIGDDQSVAECYGNLALVDLERGRPDSAKQDDEHLAKYARNSSNRDLERYSLLIEGRIDVLNRNYDQAKQSFLNIIRDSEAPISLRWEAHSRLAEVYASEGNRLGAEREFRAAIGAISEAQSSVKSEELRLSFLSSAISFYNDFIEFLISQKRAEEALQVAEVSRAQTLARGLGLRSKISFPLPNFQPRSIAQRFNATLLFYWLGEKKSYLWAVTRTGVSLLTLPPSAVIEPIAKAYEEALLGPRDVLETKNADGARLYEILAAPAGKLITPGSRVIIFPDGALYGLNFETLLVSSPQPHYWIDDAIVANANSLVLLAASSNERPGKAKKLLLIGNPVSPSPDFPDLPQATAEMSGVERFFGAPDRTVLSREQATASAYLHSDPGQFSFVHFVSHGTASRTSPLDSAVILTRDRDAFKLYARDIVTQPLHADLVTISACYGAGARTYSGEGLVGLSWAFLRAGAHSVIAALWEVNDNSTPELMGDLYAEITKGTPPDAALRHAKLKLLHSATVYQKPFYWAPFELYRGH